MHTDQTVPGRLYKYRAFGERTVSMLVEDRLHFSDPRTFNDPLDARPYVEIDVDDSALATVLCRLVEQRLTAEMQAAGKTMQVRNRQADAHIERVSRRKAKDVIRDIEYNAGNPDHDAADYKSWAFRERITGELLRRYGTGIVSLTESADCPLMWSHYGDQHRGICVGYSVPPDAEGTVRRVRYDGSRLIEVSKVAAMLDGDKVARREVDEAVLLRKAPSWKYEREWRLLGPQGLNGSPLELEEVVFGMRCQEAVKYGVMKALEHRERRPRFRELHEKRGAFDLKTVPLSYDDEMFRSFPSRHRFILDSLEGFEIQSDGMQVQPEAALAGHTAAPSNPPAVKPV